MNIAGRAGSWSAKHWKTATFGWLAFVAVALVIGQTVGTRQLTKPSRRRTARRARRRCSRAPASSRPPSEGVLVQLERLARPGSSAFGGAVRRPRRVATAACRRSERVRGSAGVEGRTLGARHLRALRARRDTADSRIQPVLDRVAAVQRAHPGLHARRGRRREREPCAQTVIEQDLRKAEITSVPVTFAILLFAFGAFVAAGLPVLLALLAVLATVGARCARQPRRPCLGRDVERRRPHGDGGRRRLLALLPAPRARGAGLRTLAA